MIRRKEPTPDGEPAWLLIPQIEHARVAGELAWALPGARRVLANAHAEWLSAVYHHDDGWQEWDSQPGLDEEHGRPRSFTEMPLSVSVDIWRRSIERCRRLGPLARFAVASHFVALFERAVRSDDITPRDKTDAEVFRNETRSVMDDEQSRLREIHAERARVISAAGLTWLQFFDHASLWLCCNAEPAPLELPTPDGYPVRCTWRATDGFHVSPWPFDRDNLEISAHGSRVPATRYADTNALLAAAQPGSVSFRLSPG